MIEDKICVNIPRPLIAYYIFTSQNTYRDDGRTFPYINKVITSNREKWLRDIKTKHFGDHSGVIFEINYSRKEAIQNLLKKLSDAIRENKTLELTTKFLILHLSLTNEFDETRVSDLSCTTRVEEPPNKKWSRQAVAVVKEEHKNFDISLFKGIKNIVILKHWSSQAQAEMNKIDISQFSGTSLQEAAKSYKTRQRREEYFAIQTTALTDVSLYQLDNSQVAFIFNTIVFSDEKKKKRESSIKDVENLSKMFLKRRITHIVMPNLQRLDVMQELIRIFASEDFSHIQLLHLFVMSHGEEGDKIYTGDDGKYKLFDIIKALSENKKMKGVNLIAVACRGGIDAFHEDEIWPKHINESHYIRNTNIVNERISVWYSTREGYKSVRYANGSPFIVTIVKQIKKVDKKQGEILLKELANKVQKELKQKNEEDVILIDVLRNPNNETKMHRMISAPENFNNNNQILFNRLLELSKKMELKLVLNKGAQF